MSICSKVINLLLAMHLLTGNWWQSGRDQQRPEVQSSERKAKRRGGKEAGPVGSWQFKRNLATAVGNKR